MSDTRRHTDKQKGWAPGNPEFDRWNEQRSSNNMDPAYRQPKIQSLKHQEKDRRSAIRQRGGKPKHRFVRDSRNTRHSLRRKIDELRLKEAMT